MKKFIYKIGAAALCLLFAAGVWPAGLWASNFRDVGPNLDWARNAIETVNELGIMTGDLMGNFNPNSHIDKFETARILARMSGFNPIALEGQEAAYFEAVFQARRPLIESVANRFTRWNHSVNREIAFLLYRGILRAADLENFVVNMNGAEMLRALSREEAAVFLVRFMGPAAEAEALRTTGVQQFSDHHLISPAAMSSVYFLRSLGILNGDGGNNVSPQTAATRAAMAILVNSTLNHVNSPLLGNTSPAAVEFETITGSIVNTFPSFRSLLIAPAVPANAATRILPVTDTAIITVGGLNANFGALVQNMTLTAVTINGEIVSITAQQPGVAGLPNVPDDESGDRVLDGIVSRVNLLNSTVGIETRMLNPRGEIITEIRDYTINSATTIRRAGVAANQNSISVGDLVVATVRGNVAVRLELEERFREVSGTLAEKNFGGNSLFPSIVVLDAAGNYHNFSVDASSTIRRQGVAGTISSRSLRIGDAITVHAEYGRVTDAFAAGTTSTVDVYIRDIFISGREQSHIVVTDTLYGSQDRRHLIIDGAFDPHSLHVGSRVRLWLDSQEVSSFSVLQSASANNFTGHIVAITPTQISVRDANFVTRHLTLDNATVLFNSLTGQSINVNGLIIGMRVQVVAAAGNVNRAASVTVLTN